MTHAPLAPSASHRWMHCPGSVHACEGLPNEETVFSAEGTFAHEIAAELLLEDKDAKTAIGRGKVVPFDDCAGGTTTKNFIVDADMAAAIQVYLNVVRGIQLAKGGTLLVEQKVRLSTRCFGTADTLIWSEDQRWLDVVDLKMGQGVYVDVEDNSQLVIYGLGALNERMIVPDRMEGVTLHIVQPRYHSADAHRQWTLTGEQLKEWRQKIASAELATNRADAPLVAGQWCRFCPARHTCKALQGAAMAAAQDVFPDLDPLAKPVAPPLVERFTNEQLAKVLRAADAAESWIKAVREQATDRARLGGVIPGYKLVQKLGHRKWINEGDAAAAFAKINVDPWAPRELMSPAAIEKKNKALKGLVAQLTTRPVSGEVLATDTDHRPALSAGDVFGD